MQLSEHALRILYETRSLVGSQDSQVTQPNETIEQSLRNSRDLIRDGSCYYCSYCHSFSKTASDSLGLTQRSDRYLQLLLLMQSVKNVPTDLSLLSIRHERMNMGKLSLRHIATISPRGGWERKYGKIRSNHSTRIDLPSHRTLYNRTMWQSLSIS